MINIKDNKIVLDLKTLRTKLQKYTFQEYIKNLNYSEAMEYLESFNGKRRHFSGHKNKHYGTDHLAEKKSGTIRKLFESMLDTSKNHSPLGKNTDWIGVEIECFIPFNSDAIESADCEYCDGTGYIPDEDVGDVECRRCEGSGIVNSTSSAKRQLSDMFKAQGVKFASIKGDGSIREDDGCFPVEITVLTRLSDSSNLKKACSILNKLGAKVNKSCGMHVHLDSRHLTQDEVSIIGNKFKKAMPVLAQCVPESRRTNSYCKLAVSKFTGCRYYAVNLTAYKKYKTIEVRLHSSTTDFKKIMEWATLLNAIAKGAMPRKVCNNLNELTDFISIPETTLEFFSQRIALFNPLQVCTSSSAIDSDNTEETQTAQVPLNNLEISA